MGRKVREPIIPELELEWFQPPAPRPQPRQEPPTSSVRFGWIGSGPSGGQIAEAVCQLDGRALAVSISPKDLRGLDLPEEQKVLLSRARKIEKGGGRNLFSRMEELFSDQVDHLMICPGAQAERDRGLIDLVRNYAQLLGFHGPRRRVGAMVFLPSEDPTVAKELMHLAEKKKIMPLILAASGRPKRKTIRPEKTKKPSVIYRRTAELFDAFNRLSACPTPYTSFDTMDYLEVLTAGGCTVMGLAELEQVEDRNALSRAVFKSLDSMVFAGGIDLRQAGAAACLVVGGRKMMAKTAGLQDAILYGFDVLTALTGRATVYRGIYEDDCPTLRIYTMISGLPAPRLRSRKNTS